MLRARPARQLEDHPVARNASESLWPAALGPQPSFRLYVLLITLFYFLITGTLNLLFGGDYSFLNFLSVVLLASVMFGPLMLNPNLGPVHVLVAPALLWFVNLVLRQSSLVAFGLPRHDVLIGLTTAELNILCAELNLLTASAHAAFLVGFFAIRTARVPSLRVPPPKLLTSKTLIVLAVSALGLLVYGAIVGGLEGMLLMRSISRGARAEIRGGDHFAVLAAIPVVLVYLLCELSRRTRPGVLFWGTLLFALLFTFLVSGSRSAVLYPLLVLILIYFLVTGMFPRIAIVLLAGFGLLLIGAVEIFRTQHFGESSVDWGIFSDYELSDVLDAGSRAVTTRATLRHGSLPPLHFVPEEVPLLLGATYLRPLLTPFPQVLLPFEKPPAVGRLNGEFFYATEAAIPVSPVVEAYWNFHVPGVLIIFFFSGLLAAYAFRTYLLNRTVPGAAVFYVLYLFYFEFSSTGLTTFIQRTVIALLLLCYLCGIPRIATWKRVRLLYRESPFPHRDSGVS